eukprot:14920436-Ditylum_brightwellii.AAC.1
MGNVIEEIPKTDSIDPPFGDDDLCIISLSLVIPVSNKHGLTSGALTLRQLEQIEDNHPITGLWGDTMKYQFSSQSGMSAITQRASDILDNQGFKSQASSAVNIVQLHKDDDDDKPFIQGIKHHLEMLKKHNI